MGAAALRELRDPYGWALAALALIANLLLGAGGYKAVAVALGVIGVKVAAGILWPQPKPEPSRGQPRAGGALTARELEVAKLVAQGLTNRQVGYRLVPQVGERGVDRHVANIMAKLNVHNRAEIAAWVTRQETPKSTP